MDPVELPTVGSLIGWSGWLWTWDAVLPEASTPLAARGFFFIIESRRAVLLHANSLSPATLCLL